jgi:hypothetical protein
MIFDPLLDPCYFFASWVTPLHVIGVISGRRELHGHGQAIAVRDCADRNGRRWDFGAVGRCRGSWRRSRGMLL